MLILGKALLILVTFVKFNWGSHWRDQRGLLQHQPGYGQHSSLLKRQRGSCKATASLAACYLLGLSDVLNWQKVMSNRCSKGNRLGKALKTCFWFSPHALTEHPFYKSMFLHLIPEAFCVILLQQWNQSSLTSLPRLGLQKPYTHLALLSRCSHTSPVNKYLAEFYHPLPS